MFDNHYHPENWGIKPVLFEVFGVGVSSYSFFVLLGLIVGAIVYFKLSRRESRNYDNTVYIFAGAFIFGVIGAKLPILIQNFNLILKDPTNAFFYLSGRTVVGGLIGGMIGVILIKRLLGIKERRGNIIAPAAAIGIGIGRIGCYLEGCCYGTETNSNFGVDFGDGILRHPTQIYEMIFHFFMFILLMLLRKKVEKPGLLFRIYVVSYFIYRFISEFIRVEPIVWLNLTGYQIAAVIGLLLIFVKEIFYKKIIN